MNFLGGSYIVLITSASVFVFLSFLTKVLITIFRGLKNSDKGSTLLARWKKFLEG